MSTGIYALTFDNDRYVYIGQAINIDSRITRHLTDLSANRHCNYKVQDKFREYGNPQYYTLELCESKDLNKLENLWIDEFNSYKAGLNLTYNDESALRGTDSNNSKYSDEQVYKVFTMLLDVTNTPTYISEVTGMSKGNINAISRGASHRYLEEVFPVEYTKLLSLVGARAKLTNSAANKGIEYPTIVSPEGKEYSNITCLKHFAIEHSIPYDGLGRVMKKSRGRKTVKGWTLKEYLSP